MIKISLDEAYVFDILSIYQVKINNFTGDKLTTTKNAMLELAGEIKDQIGEQKFDDIISSYEYAELICANQKVFNLVDLVQADTGLAKETDDANYERYLKKIQLQQKFFHNDLRETKNK
jgi:hypothetical protein